jgi:type I restriction enzyme S subunit
MSEGAENTWKTVELQELLEPGRGISYGIVQPGAEVQDGIPIVRVGDVRAGRINTQSPLRVSPTVEANYARTRLRGGELVLTLVGTVGETAIVPDELRGWNTARAVGVIPVNLEVGAYWVSLALSRPEVKERINGRLNTTVQATLNLRDVAQLPIILPPPDKRLRIEQIIGTLDDKIELNRKMNETLEAMAQALFKSWFVDFDPVRAKTEGRDTGLPAHIADLFPDSFVDSELGEIPKDWTPGCFGDVAENPRRTISAGEIATGTPYIALEHMPRECIALSGWDNADGVESSKFAFKKREILFGKLRPYFHKVGVTPIDGVCSTDILVIVPKAPEWFGFVLGHASSREFVQHTNAGSTGTKMPRTSWNDMSHYPLPIPPAPLAGAFTDFIHPMVDHLIASVHESRSLAETRDALLPKLISGEISLRNPSSPSGD